MFKQSISIILFTFLTVQYAFAQPKLLNDDEVACNRALSDNKPEKAIDIANRLLEKNEKNIHALTCQGRAYFAQNKTEEALAVFNKAEEVGAAGYDKAFASLLAGHVYKNTSQLDKSLEAYQRSLDYAKSIDHQALMLNDNMNVGHVLTEQKKYEAAVASYQAAYKLSANDNERAETASYVATTYHALNKDDKAVEYQIKAVLMNEKVGTLDQYAQALVSMTQYQLAASRFADAERYAQKLIKFAQENGGAYYEAKAQLLLAKSKAAQHAMKEAKALLDAALPTAKKTQDATLIKAIEEYRATL